MIQWRAHATHEELARYNELESARELHNSEMATIRNRCTNRAYRLRKEAGTGKHLENNS